jgi:hypothetical protein
MDSQKITLEELEKYREVAEYAKKIIWHELVNELKLQPPSRFLLVGRNGMVWLLAIMNPRALGTSIKKYHNPQVVHQISTAFAGKPVFIANQTGLRYGVMLSAKPTLPKKIIFPGLAEKKDVFLLGRTLQKEITLKASQLKNVLIGAAQGSGKSNTINLLVHQMRAFGWQLYLADPQEHTFNPDIWDSIAAHPVASKDDEVITVLERIKAEIEARKAAFRELADGSIPPSDIDAYNAVSPTPMPRIGFLIDEANTFLANKQIFTMIADLLRQGRKWGLHIVLAGHEWHKRDVPSSVNDMLQTRLALSTPDEYSGGVVLRSSRWGRWVMDQPAGRGALKASSRVTAMQFYLVTDEQQREWLSGNASPSPLTDDERAYVAYALEQGGAFTISALVNHFDVGEWTMRKLAKSWEQRGWLDEGKSASAPRMINETLIQLAGLPPKNNDISLARSHGSDALGRLSHSSHALSHRPRTLARSLAQA